MKISIIGAGNVGALSAMHIAQAGLGDVVLVDVLGGLAEGKAKDLEDSRAMLKANYNIRGTDNIEEIKDSDLVVITAGLARKPGMLREELLLKNAQILKGLSLSIKKLTPHSIIVVVTNPLDAMTYLVLKTTGFSPAKVLGMGPNLDAARFANLISQGLKIALQDIEATVIGSHGEGMLVLPRFTYIKGIKLDEFADDKEIKDLIEMTHQRGKEIVTLLGTGSAYFAPSLAVFEIVRILAQDKKRAIGVSAYLNGEYGIKDICIGVPCLLGRNGIEKIIALDLNADEKKRLIQSANALRKLISQLNQ